MNNKQNFENEEMEIDLIELVHVLLRKWWLILVVALAGFAISVGYTKFAVTPMYESKAMLYVLPNTTSVTSVADLQIGMAITGDFEVIATSKPVIDKAIQTIKKEEGKKFTRSTIKGMITVENMEDTRILVIKAKSANPEHACWVANAMAEATAERMAEITKKDPPTTVEMAEVSKSPVSPSMTKNAALGFIIGAVLVCGILVVQFLLNDNIKTEEDVEKYLGEVTLVSIPYIKSKVEKKDEKKAKQGGKRGRKE